MTVALVTIVCLHFVSNHKGDLSFVGRSGTAMDVRYTAHDFGEMPEETTKHVVAFFSQNSKSVPIAKGIYHNL